MKLKRMPVAVVALAAVGLGGCEDATAPEQAAGDTALPVETPALGIAAAPEQATAASVALADAAQRIVPTLADARLAAKLGLAMDALAAKLATADPRIIKFGLDVAHAAVDAYQARATAAAAEAPDLDAIRLALDTVEERLLTTGAE
jgi:hypothetical protein